jgi:hypothetical protein
MIFSPRVVSYHFHDAAFCFQGKDFVFSLSLGYKCDWSTNEKGYVVEDVSAMSGLVREYKLATSSAGKACFYQ